MRTIHTAKRLSSLEAVLLRVGPRTMRARSKGLWEFFYKVSKFQALLTMFDVLGRALCKFKYMLKAYTVADSCVCRNWVREMDDHGREGLSQFNGESVSPNHICGGVEDTVVVFQEVMDLGLGGWVERSRNSVDDYWENSMFQH